MFHKFNYSNARNRALSSANSASLCLLWVQVTRYLSLDLISVGNSRCRWHWLTDPSLKLSSWATRANFCPNNYSPRPFTVAPGLGRCEPPLPEPRNRAVVMMFSPLVSCPQVAITPRSSTIRAVFATDRARLPDDLTGSGEINYWISRTSLR